MKLTSLLIITCLSSAVAQSDYAITSKSDTLKGEVKILTYDLNDQVQVKIDKKRKVYTSLQVKSVFLNGETYQTVKFEGRYRFMKLLKPGFLTLYGFRLTNQQTYDGRYLLKKDGIGMEIPNLTFKKSMASFLSSCPEVEEKIKNGDLGRKDVDQIIDQFNTCIIPKAEKNVVIVPELTPVENGKILAISTLIVKVDSSSELSEKTDILDLLKDLKSKVGRGEILPNYLIKDITNHLSDKPEFKEDLDKLLVLLKQ